MNADFGAAYRATSYVAFGPEGRFTIRVDESTPALDDLLLEHGVPSWAFITAWNPGSQGLPPEENRQRQEALEQLISEARYPHYPGESVGPDGTWREESVLILGITPEDAVAAGKQFGQNAILVGEIGAPARLEWIE